MKICSGTAFCSQSSFCNYYFLLLSLCVSGLSFMHYGEAVEGQRSVNPHEQRLPGMRRQKKSPNLPPQMAHSLPA